MVAWERIQDPNEDEPRWLDREFAGKVRFLVDENIDQTLVLALTELGWKAESIQDAGLSGRPDEDVFACAWWKKLMLLTSDKGFLDDRRFPPNRNPGVIVLPNAPIDCDSFTTALCEALYTIGPLGKAYRRAKIVITAGGEISLTCRNIETGAMETNRFRLDQHGNTYIWK